MFNIGLDFGTTNSTISYLENNKVEAFQYGGPDGRKYIPSFIAYLDEYGEIEVGAAARATVSYQSQIESYANFKMHLPLPETEFSSHFKNNRTPISVTTDYLRQILVSPDNEYSFREQQGEISKIVVSVPEIWHRDVNNTGRERLQKLIREELGFGNKLIQLVSEPVAAAAYYVWEDRQRNSTNKDKLFSGNLLVCDMGGGTFDVSLCKIHENSSVEVLYFDGEGHRGLECAGVAFDKYCVQTAYAKKHGKPLNENDPKFKTLMNSFESLKIARHTRCTKILSKYLDNPAEFSDKEVYSFDEDYNLTNKEVQEVFAPISEGIHRVLCRVRDWLKQHNQSFNRLFLVGGFCQFVLVQKAIFDSLNITKDDPRYDRSFNIANSTYAISFGACVIANGLVDPSEKFVHKLGIQVRNPNPAPRFLGLASNHEEYVDVTVIDGNQSTSELSETIFLDQKLRATYPSFPLTIWVIPQSTGQRCSLQEFIDLPSHSQESEYRVGMRVDRSQIAYLVIREINSNSTVEYELGNIISKLFPKGLTDSNADRWQKLKSSIISRN